MGNLYKCTIIITDGENIEEQEFYVEADTFEKAVENVKYDLDILLIEIMILRKKTTPASRNAQGERRTS